MTAVPAIMTGTHRHTSTLTPVIMNAFWIQHLNEKLEPAV